MEPTHKRRATGVAEMANNEAGESGTGRNLLVELLDHDGCTRCAGVNILEEERRNNQTVRGRTDVTVHTM